jgi:hypothetical protein
MRRRLMPAHIVFPHLTYDNIPSVTAFLGASCLGRRCRQALHTNHHYSFPGQVRRDHSGQYL